MHMKVNRCRRLLTNSSEETEVNCEAFLCSYLSEVVR